MDPAALAFTGFGLAALGVLYALHMRDERRWARDREEERRQQAIQPAE